MTSTDSSDDVVAAAAAETVETAATTASVESEPISSAAATAAASVESEGISSAAAATTAAETAAAATTAAETAAAATTAAETAAAATAAAETAATTMSMRAEGPTSTVLTSNVSLFGSQAIGDKKDTQQGKQKEEEQEPEVVLPECPLCCEAYDDGVEGAATYGKLPYLLSCGHSFCASCLQMLSEHAHSAAAGFISCPTCNEHTTLRESDAGLRKNFALIDVIAQLKAIARYQEKRRSKNTPVTAPDDGLFGSALPPYNYDEATVVTEEDKVAVKRSEKKRAAEAEKKNEDPLVCKKHHEEKKLYCRVCAKLCCPMCAAMSKEHHGHEMILREKGMEELAKALGEHSTKLQKAMPKDKLASVEASMRALHEVRESAKQQVYDSMEAVHAIIDDRRDRLVKDTRKDIDVQLEQCKTLADVAQDQVKRGTEAIGNAVEVLDRANAKLVSNTMLSDQDFLDIIRMNEILSRLIPPAAMSLSTIVPSDEAVRLANTQFMAPNNQVVLQHITEFGRFSTGDEPPPKMVVNEEAAKAAEVHVVPPKPIPVMRLNQEEATPSIRANPREFFQWLIRQVR